MDDLGNRLLPSLSDAFSTLVHELEAQVRAVGAWPVYRQILAMLVLGGLFFFVINAFRRRTR